MTETDKGTLDQLLQLAVEFGRFPSADRALFRCRESFQHVDVAGKRVLEIGAGAGIFSAYAAMIGARRVLALEPETMGATKGVASDILRMKEELAMENFEVSGQTLQDYDSGGEKFDIVLAHNSVNHWNEPMCEQLGCNGAAREVYRRLFERVADLTDSGGRLILTDCCRHTFFPLLGLRNPVARSIEWHKHQSPRLWARLAGSAGFRRESLSWRPLFRLRALGWLAANRVAAFFLAGGFRLVLRRE